MEPRHSTAPVRRGPLLAQATPASMDIGLIGGTCPSNRHAPIGGEGSLRLAAAAEVGAVPRSPIPAPVGRQQIHTFTRAPPPALTAADNDPCDDGAAAAPAAAAAAAAALRPRQKAHSCCSLPKTPAIGSIRPRKSNSTGLLPPVVLCFPVPIFDRFITSAGTRVAY
ncbi:hypothetical protein ACCO45_001064 [Purpureocillium lilacinum]|uniref:Uncharacterized protein n=1 Tax=Purpureocillium lilacinum TaxID=33203 RepID=A0ACC4E5Y5_PURLI